MNNIRLDSEPVNAKNFYDKQFGENLSYFHINVTLLKDVYPIDVGYEKHTVKNNFTNKYPYYLLHFVKRGKGKIEFDGVITELPKNSLFILPPNKTITYHTMPNWEYYWINFNGTAVKNILNKLKITEERYAIAFPNNAPLKFFKNAFSEPQNKTAQIFNIFSCLFSVFSLIAKQSVPYNDSMKNSPSDFGEILNYIHEHLFDADLSAGKVAERFFISDCYFSTLFKKNANSSFKEYVNYERIKKASEFLTTTNMSVKQIAEAVGFTDPLYFSKVFKRYRLISPLQYRLSMNEDAKRDIRPEHTEFRPQ